MATNMFHVETLHRYVRVTILDHKDQEVYNDFVSDNKVSKALPNGIYTVRAELNGQIEEQTVLHKDGDTNVQLVKPAYYTSALIPGAETSHEYYTNSATYISRKVLLEDRVDVTAKSSLFLFLRYSSRKHYQLYNPGPASDHLDRIISDFFLMDQENTSKHIVHEDLQKDYSNGSAGFSKISRAGLYYLVYRGKITSRQIPIYLFENWQTQVFITLADEPLFASMRVTMAPIKRGFQQAEDEVFAVDYVINRLQNNQYNLPPSIQRTLFDGKFENPMLGILGAYAYLLGERHDDDLLIETVLNNLETRIIVNSGSPDIEVLKLLASRHLDRPYNPSPVSSPPIIRIGLEKLIEEAVRFPELIPENSLNDLISTHLYADTVWTTWKNGKLFNDFNNRVRFVASIKGFATMLDETSTERPIDISWGEVSILKSIDQAIGRGSRLSLEMLAAQVNLPFNTTKRIVERLTQQEAVYEIVDKLKEKQIIKRSNRAYVAALQNLLKDHASVEQDPVALIKIFGEVEVSGKTFFLKKGSIPEGQLQLVPDQGKKQLADRMSSYNGQFITALGAYGKQKKTDKGPSFVVHNLASHDEIARRAYDLSQENPAIVEINWLRAENELLGISLAMPEANALTKKESPEGVAIKLKDTKSTENKATSKGNTGEK